MKTVKYFSATWCGPCQTFKPIMTELAHEGHHIEIIDVDEDKDATSKFNIRSIPTVVIEENGIEIDRFIGALSKNEVIERIT